MADRSHTPVYVWQSKFRLNAEHIRGFAIMRYINILFTLTLTLTHCDKVSENNTWSSD